MIAPVKPTVPVLTTGRIAQQLGQPLHRIQYVLRTRPHIRPRAMAGRMRVYDEAGLAAIRAELARIDDRQRGAKL